MRLLGIVALALLSLPAFAAPPSSNTGPRPNPSAYQHANDNARFQRGDQQQGSRGPQDRDRRGVPVNVIDRNGDGFISRDELHAFREQMEQRREDRRDERGERDDMPRPPQPPRPPQR